MTRFTNTSVKRTLSGQTIYQAMLVMTCVALALAITFPILEYISLYAQDAPSSTRTRRAPAKDTTDTEKPKEDKGTSDSETTTDGDNKTDSDKPE
jgi:hypothetical protein